VQLPPEMTEKYLNRFEKWETGTKLVNGVDTNVIYGVKEDGTKKVIAMEIEINGELRMTTVSETVVYDKENNPHGLYVYIDPNWNGADPDDGQRRGRFYVNENTASMLFGKPEDPNAPVFWNALAQQLGLSVDNTIDLVMRKNDGEISFNVPVGERSKISSPSEMIKLPFPANLNKPIAIRRIFSSADYDRLSIEIKEKRSVITYEREGEPQGQFAGKLLWTDNNGQLIGYCILNTIEIYFGLDPEKYDDGNGLNIDSAKGLSKQMYSMFDLIGDGKANKVKYYGDSVLKAFDADLVNFR